MRYFIGGSFGKLMICEEGFQDDVPREEGVPLQRKRNMGNHRGIAHTPINKLLGLLMPNALLDRSSPVPTGYMPNESRPPWWLKKWKNMI